MRIENQATCLRQLKGAPLSVLMAIIMAGQQVNQKWLETVTGYSDKPVSKALEFLKELGYVQQLSGQKFVISTAVQLPFSFNNEENSFPQLIHNLSTGYPQIEEESHILDDKSHIKSDDLLKSRNYSDFSPTTTTVNNKVKLKELKAVEEEKSRRNSDFQENIKTLRKCGIGDPMLSVLADLEWVNHDYILEMWGLSRGQTSLLIHKIRSHDLPPTLSEDEESYKKYTKGKYGKFFNS